MNIDLKPIGFVRTEAEKVPRHWTVSDVEGRLVVDEAYLEGLRNIEAGQRIVVIFHFHQSPPFSPAFLIQRPPHRNEDLGVFSICSPIRPNPIGMSVVDVLDREKNVITVTGVDMVDGTPILDIKPHVEGKKSCPSYEGERHPSVP